MVFSCGKQEKHIKFNSIEVETLLRDSLLSVRAITILNDKSLAFAANNGVFGMYSPNTKTWQTAVQKHDSLLPHFRAVAHTATNFLC